MDKKSLIEFPCNFPLKIIGNSTESFVDEIISIVLQHFPDTLETNISAKMSEKGNYVSISAIIYAKDQQALDDLYRALTAHPDIRMVL